ncbi:MAG TPA: ribonuclease III [Magnetospirillaceae bacterium]|nr:ribonuclease III [Magnetospirillaceae bacterium]
MLFGTKGVSRDRRDQLVTFQRDIGVRFKSLELLSRALTHRSRANEDQSRNENNERLEFLGDAVLGMLAASYLYRELPDRAEGELARIKSFIVSEETLSDIALGLGVDRVLLIGKGEEQSGGRGKRAILADAMEAVIGACYLDQGLDRTSAFILRLLSSEVDKVLENRHRKDYKTIIQEYVQKQHRSYPRYSVVRRSGPDHDRTFWVACTIEEQEYGPAEGKNKKEAEQKAARLAYETILSAGGAEARMLRELG